MSTNSIPAPLYQDYTSAEMYERDNIRWCSPMLAKEIEDDEKQVECLSNPDYFVEEKFDGTRATLHFTSKGARVFSRRISEKTGWFCENSDSVPHIRDLDFSDLEVTIIDGEMFIPNRPFKDVSSTLNCKWDKAIERQQELGKIVFHAFDILYYKGIRVEMLPLYRRKVYLQEVIDTLNSPYVEMVKYYSCDSLIPVSISDNQKSSLIKLGSTYPQLVSDLKNHTDCLTPKGYYEYIIATGGEGVIVKPKSGKYYYKRGWEYSKIKKFLTREVIVLGFTQPTDDYKGKFPTVSKWDYWETSDKQIFDLSTLTTAQRKSFADKYYPDNCRPVSKFYAKNWIGNIIFGVIISKEEEAKLPSNKKFEFRLLGDSKVLVVGECAGFDESVREELSLDPDKYFGTVIEVKANEIFNDTGKLRHPRFLRFREDKSPFECKWADHLSQKILR